MTTNEQIAKGIANLMGWGYRGGYFVLGKKYYTMTNKFFEMYIAKALQQHMVDDGWILNMDIGRAWDEELGVINFFSIDAYHVRRDIPQQSATKATEPAAIVSLFCKVYGIEVEHE